MEQRSKQTYEVAGQCRGCECWLQEPHKNPLIHSGCWRIWTQKSSSWCFKLITSASAGISARSAFFCRPVSNYECVVQQLFSIFEWLLFDKLTLSLVVAEMVTWPKGRGSPASKASLKSFSCCNCFFSLVTCHKITPTIKIKFSSKFLRTDEL